MVEEKIRNASPDTWIFFTDGSAKPNPGPCGAGCSSYIRTKTGVLWHHEIIHEALGEGTNNLGELWAIGMAVTYAHQRIAKGLQPPTCGLILSDSKYAQGCLSLHWKATTNLKLVEAILQIMHNSPTKWIIEWTPGHAAVQGNEEADAAADKGSARSKAGHGPTSDQRENLVSQYQFITKPLDNINLDKYPS